MKVWILLENKHKRHLPETHRLSLYWQSLVSTRVLLLLLQICKFAFGMVSFASLLVCVSSLAHFFFSLRGSKHSICHTKLCKAFTLSVQSTSAPNLGVDLFVAVPLVHCLVHRLLLGSATSQGHLSWNHAVLALSNSEEKGWCLYFWKPHFLSRKTLSNLGTWEKNISIENIKQHYFLTFWLFSLP